MKSPFSECRPRWVHKSSHSRGPTSCHAQSASWCWKCVALESSIKSGGGGGGGKDSNDLKSHSILSEEESEKKVNLFDCLPHQPFIKSSSSKCWRCCDKHREAIKCQMSSLILVGLQMSLSLFGCSFMGSVPGLTEGLASVNNLLERQVHCEKCLILSCYWTTSVSDEFHSLVDLAILNSMNFCEK